jgi:hypothetical protein
MFDATQHDTDLMAGTGAVYSFDPVGSYERETCRAAGAAQALVQPFLDNQVSVVCPSLLRPQLTMQFPFSPSACSFPQFEHLLLPM